MVGSAGSPDFTQTGTAFPWAEGETAIGHISANAMGDRSHCNHIGRGTTEGVMKCLIRNFGFLCEARMAPTGWAFPSCLCTATIEEPRSGQARIASGTARFAQACSSADKMRPETVPKVVFPAHEPRTSSHFESAHSWGRMSAVVVPSRGRSEWVCELPYSLLHGMIRRLSSRPHWPRPGDGDCPESGPLPRTVSSNMRTRWVPGDGHI
jgi:hypothetical protein